MTLTILNAPSSTLPLAAWAGDNLDDVKAAMDANGGVLLRGFDTSAPAVMRDLLSYFGHDPMEDAKWSSPRHEVGDGAFTSTDYPPDETIVLHSEMSYARLWPRFVMFQCRIAAATGGATTIGDLRAISESLGDLVEEFHERDVLYIRNFRPGVDIRWQDAFGVDDQAAVERIGAANGLEVEWLADGVLRTYQQAQGAVLDHGAPIWFNQAHLFHPSQLKPETRSGLLSAFGEEGLPRNAVFGDGEPIPDATIAFVLDTLTRHTEEIPWRDGDIAILDNMRWMHGRAPFTGDRKVHVAMGGPHKARTTTPLFQ